VIGLTGLAAAFYVYGKGLERADRLQQRFAGLHRLLSGKYYVDELYEAVLGRPLHWISERVFLDLGDRALIDGTLHGLTGLAQRAAGRLSRVETGNLQFYVLLAALGVVASLAWMWGHG
jgi:NADH-quinone oxidoreductase subunit L